MNAFIENEKTLGTVYVVDDDEAEAFDRQFPPKQKLKLPGQLV